MRTIDGDALDDFLASAEIEAINKKKYVLAGALNTIRGNLRNFPSAQPEPLTDKEQRIFLAAMSREEKVCKQVDDEFRDCREPYEENLVRIFHEITRKVKGALWGGK